VGPSRVATTALVALVALTACTTSSPEPASPGAPRAPASRTSPTPASPTDAAPTSSPTGSVAPTDPDSARIAPPPGGSLLVRGSYPRFPSPCADPEPRRLLARYPGTLSIQRSDDGRLSLTVTLPFQRYLEGIAEVPPSWPREALEAQAVAARSYALATTGWSGEEGETLDTPICATTACQVYRGIPVPFESGVRRWYRAVRQTSGQVLLFEGRPATTVYFSTSNGQTYGNEDVFGSAPLPYLRPVVENDDGASPTSRWSVRLPFDDLARFLGAAGEWRRTRTITDVRLDGATFVVSGDGRTRSIESSTFREAVNTWAPCLAPDRYPPPSRFGTALPTTIPSRWLSASSEGGTLVVAGRGWGHGAGMVQWGAYGKALRGVSASDILAHYYGGLRPQTYPEPGLIHVQVADGLTGIRVTPSAPGALVDAIEIGSQRISVTGGEALVVTTEPR
jgi:stage II sporulation protein D